VLCPSAQGFFALAHELVPLIHGSDTGNRPARVVQDLIGYVRSYAKARHSGDYRST
jgi:hypothetical protein